VAPEHLGRHDPFDPHNVLLSPRYGLGA